MKKRWMKRFTVFLLCFSFVFTGKEAFAASAPTETTVNKIAYVNTSGKLILKFTDFCKSGYTYRVTNIDTAATQSGTVNYGSGTLSYSLKDHDFYQENTRYKLVLTGKDKKQKLTTYYYTGQVLKSYSLGKSSDDSLKASWSISNKTTYTSYSFGVYTGSSAATRQKLVTADAKTTTKSIASSSLKNARYYTYLIGCKSVKGVTYYGEGRNASIDYVKKPGKVIGVTADPNANRVKLSWSSVKEASYYTVYQSTKKSSGYTAVKTNLTGTSLTVTGLTGGKTYYYKVVAVSRVGSKTVAGTASSIVTSKVPLVAGKVTGVKFTLDSSNQLAVTWTRTKNATGYRIYYRKAGQTTYKRLGYTKNNIYNLSDLNSSTKYQLNVRAYTTINGKTYLASQSSNAYTISPGEYMNKNYNRLLASKVRTIGYVGSKCVYTTKKYSKEVKTAFVNYKGYSSSTKYLIWISHYTQQVSIFTGKKGNWKLIRTFLCATGTAQRHSPRGVFKISYKEKGWYYTSTKVLYVTHYSGRNSFHTRPLWNSGAVQDATIGKPASHGCVRCYNSDAKYVYDKMPKGTTVVSY